MGDPVAWWQNNDDGTYTIWHQNPEEYGVPLDGLVPLYDGWQESFNEFIAGIPITSGCYCQSNGTFVELPNIRPEPVDVIEEVQESDESDTVWTQIADAIRTGINDY